MADRDDRLDSLNWALDQLQHHSNAVAYHHEQLRKCLDFADPWTMKAIARAAALGDANLADRLRKADNARCDVADAADDVAEHVAALARHVDKARDRADELDGGAKAALRRREKQIAATQYRMAATDAVMEARFPSVPAVFKTADHERQVHVILAGASEADVDLSSYRDAVLLKHTGAPVAWCFRIKRDYAGRLVASAQFPPRGVSPRADKTFESIRAGKLKAASVGLSVVAGVKMLKEWSFVPAGADPEARVTAVGGDPVGGFNRSTGGFLSPYGVENAREQAKRLYAGRWGLN
jgi:hypothetical protein